MCKIIAIANQKGGVRKTTTTVNLGIALVNEGKRVLLVDADPQGSLTVSLGYSEQDELQVTITDKLMDVINEEENDPYYGILHHEEGVDLLSANIELSAMEATLINMMSRERILKCYLDEIKESYDYVLIDCMPSLGMMTINALTAADYVLIPVHSSYLPVKGLEQLLTTISKVKMQLNKDLQILGILMTMVDFRTVYARDIYAKVIEIYGKKIGNFDTYIPFSVRAAETSAEERSIFCIVPQEKLQGHIALWQRR